MKTQRPEIELTAVVDALFRRCPSLVGFSVGELSASGLVVSNIETDPWPAHSPELVGEIAEALGGFVDEQPAARELLRGRTFARTLH
jgi:hypothetical protein